MTVEILVVATILLVTVSLIVDELNLNIYRPVGNAVNAGLLWAGDHTLFGQVVKKGIEVRKKEIEAEELKKYKEHILKMMKDAGVPCSGVYGGDYDWSPVAVHIKPEGLHDARRVMRLIVGSWNDEIVPGSCEEDWSTKKHVLSVSYHPKEELKRKTTINTKYDLDNLPKGLLKEGCRVEREYKTVMTCAVRCAA